MYECMLCLLRGGHPLDFLHEGSLTSLEARSSHRARLPGDAPYLNDALELARAVRAAQSTSTSTRLTLWQKYPRRSEGPRCASGRSARSHGAHARKDAARNRVLFARSFPNESYGFWNACSRVEPQC